MILPLGMGVTVVIGDGLSRQDDATNQGDSDPNVNAILVGPCPRVGG